jgi:hypothetical protein
MIGIVDVIEPVLVMEVLSQVLLHLGAVPVGHPGQGIDIH